MKKNLLFAFWNCGDDDIIQFALLKAHLNKNEKAVLILMLDECMTQEEIAEQINYSTRRVQQFWSSGARKLLDIPWVKAYAQSLIL
ncbi:MAG: hypothetical protein MJ007_01940 [Paludibacteraceae bacterium]|nr:hypothetical protein [Paludibacteraceae bacterium]